MMIIKRENGRPSKETLSSQWSYYAAKPFSSWIFSNFYLKEEEIFFFFLFVRKEVFWEAERQVKIHKRNLFCFFSKRFGVRERRSPGIFSLNRDKIKEEEEEQYQARLFSWQHHSAGTKREKEKRFRTRTWRYSSRDENKRRKKTNHQQQQQHHTDTHVLVFYYMPVFFSKKKNLFHHHRDQVRALWSKVLHDRFGMRSPFKLRRNTHKPQQQQQRQRPE